MKHLWVGIGIVAASVALSGCEAPRQGSRTFTADQAQMALQSFPAIVLRVSEVQIQHEERGIGAAMGAGLGGVAGSTIGQGRGTRLATAGGVAAGAAIGSAAAQARNTRPAWELEVELDDGRIMVVVQEQDDEFAAGDHVRVIQARDGSFRVRQ